MNIASNFLLGRYRYGETPIHSIDARVKIFLLFIVSISLFFINTVSGYAYPFFLLAVVVYMAKVRIITLIRGIMPVIWIMAFTFLLHALIPPRNIEYAVVVSVRLILIFCCATLLTATTTSIGLSKAISWYLGPLRVFGLSPEKTAFVFSLSLRFFPIILEEAESILKAQRLRHDNLGFLARVEAFITVFMIRALKRAGSIELALMNRDIKDEKIRYMNSFKLLGTADFAALMIGIIYTALMFLRSY
ncbi:MAG: energy-coupling factor transporter transmembrane component T [Elusimicrobiota bacterium]